MVIAPTSPGASTANLAECGAGRVRIANLGAGGAMGTFYAHLVARSTAAAPCAFDESHFAVTWAGGRSHLIPANAGSQLPLEVGGSQGFRLGFYGSCHKVFDPNASPSTFTITGEVKGEPIRIIDGQLPVSVSTCTTALLQAIVQPDPEDR